MRLVRLACFCLALLAPRGAARADDWLAVLPACDAALAHDVGPVFEIAYPRPGLPALVEAGQMLIARVRLPSPLTPPPGVQQERALAGFAAQLVGHPYVVGSAAHTQRGAEPDHSYLLPVVNVRPDDPASLVYRVSLPIPAWVAPGTYDLVMSAPGGTGRARSLVRVLSPGQAPRAAWVMRGEVPETAAVAALPFDLWVRSEPDIDTTDRDERSALAPEAARAPLLDPRGLNAALRIDGGLWVLGGCDSPHVRFDDEVASVLVREQRARRSIAPPVIAAPGFAAWDLASRFQAWPNADALRVEGDGDRVRVRVTDALSRAEISLLLIDAGRGAQTNFGALSFYPSNEVAELGPLALVAQLQLSGPGEALVQRTQASAAPALLVQPVQTQSGEVVRVGIAPGAPGWRIAYRFDAQHTAFTAAEVAHTYQAVGVQQIEALAIAADGAATRVKVNVDVGTALHTGCRCQLASGPVPQAAWLMPATLAATGVVLARVASQVRRRRNRARKALSEASRE